MDGAPSSGLNTDIKSGNMNGLYVIIVRPLRGDAADYFD